MIAFPRTALAQELVAALQGKALLGDAHNGLFLAAPRRTGESTFRQDAWRVRGGGCGHAPLVRDPCRRRPLAAGSAKRAVAFGR
ncbi:hypothetical protein [Sphaerotilus montanus]|uniref:hypothetical protein n=1 Tax=Sphaerotilus montanus TaxID=522889 RepID=UPI003FA330E9